MKNFFIVTLFIIGIIYFASLRNIPEKIKYGVSFSVFHSRELKLDWKQVYDELLNDLNIKRFRFSAHWHITEPENNLFNWSELDYQITEAEKHNAKIVFAVGRRLPGWPECHEPSWATNLPVEQKREELLEYIRAVVNRYKKSPAVLYWQIENEPFLTFFAKSHCGDFLDEDFLNKEIELVRSLDPNRKILVTDSGELSLWYKAHRSGDLFGSSVYLYIWNHHFGQIRYPITPGFFRIKRNVVELFFGKKESLLIELSTEPWLLQPIVETPIDTALEQMDIHKFNKIINFAQNTGFAEQYLWGAEWWYFMKENNHPEFWERAKEIFSESE